MTKILVMSGVGNTGKSSLIHGHPQAPGIKEILESKGYSVRTTNETAREVVEAFESKGKQRTQTDLQNKISRLEEVRLAHIAKATEDIVLVDRTIVDNWAYALFNAVTGKLEGELSLKIPPMSADVDLYDRVYYFDNPVKDTTTSEFQHYNDEYLNRIMREMVKNRYGTKAVLYQNAIVDRNKIIADVLNLIKQ